MNRKPLLLDLYCCAGGCSRGYVQAGFEVVGVDLDPQPHYPYTFVQDDTLHVLDVLLSGGQWNGYTLSDFDAFHASPPCQAFSLASYFHHSHGRHLDLIGPTRSRLQATGKPYIIENVPNAPVEKAVTLCGAMFGLRTYRHRLFESNLLLFQPAHPRHVVRAAGPGTIAKPDEFWSVGGHFGHKDEAQRALGIDWMTTTHEIAQAIPPAYTHYLGLQVFAALESEEMSA